MRTYGLIVRMFSPDEHGAQERVDVAMNDLFALRRRLPQEPLREVFFLVPEDHDQGETYDKLSVGLLGQKLIVHHHVFSVPGHPNREVLNTGALMLERCDVTHLIVAAPKALPYLTPSRITEFDAWFEVGAKVVGIKAGELSEMIGDGCVQNTLAVWDLEALRLAGRFESVEAEEIAPTVKLARRYGKCIAVIEGGEGPLDLRDSVAARAGHARRVALKQAQQAKELERVRGEFGMLALAVMNRS